MEYHIDKPRKRPGIKGEGGEQHRYIEKGKDHKTPLKKIINFVRFIKPFVNLHGTTEEGKK